MRRLVFLLMVLLGLLHHDFWLWADKSLVLGFLPSGLAYHMGYSLAAALVGWLAVTYAWPHEAEALAEGSQADGDRS